MVRLRKGQDLGQDQSEKILDVDASMQGSLVFKDPVHLRINGNFEGTLDTKGKLVIGDHAEVKADIKGEDITIAGHVRGDITADRRLELTSSAYVHGNVTTKALKIAEGAIFDGICKMNLTGEISGSGNISADELAKYLEIDTSMVFEWAKSGRIPATRRGEQWTFERRRIEEWLAKEKAQ